MTDLEEKKRNHLVDVSIYANDNGAFSSFLSLACFALNLLPRFFFLQSYLQRQRRVYRPILDGEEQMGRRSDINVKKRGVEIIPKKQMDENRAECVYEEIKIGVFSLSLPKIDTESDRERQERKVCLERPCRWTKQRKWS